NRVGGSAAHVVDLPGSTIYTLDGLQHGLDEVVNIKQVPHLVTVTVDRQLPALERRPSEVRHPALVLGAQLAAAIDAGHPKHDGGQSIDAMVISDVLVRGALGTAVRRVKIERKALRDAFVAVSKSIASLLLDDLDPFQAPVNLVGRSEEKRW